ncbi:DUF2309 domain-containing protein [Legionella anisa]|uniref:Probable inorganic carbon transporter subunit DabA n=1 Tax=Legionella anisa TaxID=28082 RepID=A0AAX0WP64_9GAMM|nr:DUF2309 domain-containing protein [Legionella anisa]AWN73058.1 DUF2309 domain-containing protein [Legionella anisa]KTC67511.1 hypothetical protein Lani_3856 [Legionella anisa]MBN5936267.1 DUF2309 domain-containing protein [Legionella anisa]MCW8423884.1 DUF2309 domain-containing protein [Legionella anisa]MCW8447406.1 DUF2309 domain-containing protein [Legionella anisa]
MSTAKVITNDEKTNEHPMKTTTSVKAPSKSLEVRALIDNAAQRIAPVWPLETFIACNPLQGFEAQSFEEAIAQGGFRRKEAPRNRALENVNLQMIKWCGGFFDAGQGAIEMPYKDKGFYYGFLKLACFDKKLHDNKKEAKQWILTLPESAEEAIILCLQKLKVPKEKTEEFFTQTFLYLPGWAGFVKWKTHWHNPTTEDKQPVTLAELLAVRLVITCLLWPEAAQEKKSEEDGSLAQKVLEQLKENEKNYEQTLLKTLLPAVKRSATITKRADAQLVFCIDVRSEPIRRAIERLGNYETLGFAGFFGIPIRVQEFESGKTKDCCPVLLKPRYRVDEKPYEVNSFLMEQHQQGKTIKTTLGKIYQELKYNFATPFALVETLGAWYGLKMVLQALAPSYTKKTSHALNHLIAPQLQTEPSFELDEDNLEHGIALSEQIDYAETVLRLMGLTSGFAKLIILCGHGSTTENNPYASALDCGACGGNHGGTNAKLLARILNKIDVRRALEEKGIHIPMDTLFYAALHNTTTDSIELYNLNTVKVLYPNLVNQLRVDLEEAKSSNNLERGQKLNSAHPEQDIQRRSQDWSETRPEWGLARNAAFIVAPRSLTKNINLDGRCFLHSYDWEEDYEGSFLETILTAPMVVAQWINTQYLFSTLDNVAYGSGSKITHNVTGKMGIMQGNGSDLMHGLPLQSVMSSDESPYHQPQRLLTVVYAPQALVSKIIERQAILKTLFFNEWVHLIVINPTDGQAYKLNQNGNWILTH